MRFIKKVIFYSMILIFLIFSNLASIQNTHSSISPFICTENSPLEAPVGITKDKLGNIYIAQGLTYNTIGKISSEGKYSILAGSPHESGFTDGIGSNARFNGPSDLVVDSNGEYLYVTDYYNHLIRRIRTSDGEVITIAGIPRKPGLVNGTGGLNTNTQFYNPAGIGIDKNNNLYIADSTNAVIRKISSAPNYEVTTIAGNGARDWKDGPVDQASFAFPEDIAIDDTNGNLYITENKNQTIRMVTFKNGSGTVSTLATTFGIPHGIGVDSTGLVYFTDSLSQVISTITKAGAVNIIAGKSRNTGNIDGDALAAKFNQPLGIFIENSNKIYITDFQNKSVRVLSGEETSKENKKNYQVSTLNVCPTLIEPIPTNENVGKK